MVGLADLEVKRLAEFVTANLGLSYPKDRYSDLILGFNETCHDLGIDDMVDCLPLLNDDSQKLNFVEHLASHLTVGETYFFRDKNLFSYLKDHLLSSLIQKRRSEKKYIRIWSAACSSGEEPYSIAILLRYLLLDLHDWDIFILATDINNNALENAAKGVYSRFSFREDPVVPLKNYVMQTQDGKFEISQEIRQMVTFRKLNLISQTYPSTHTSTMSMDLILCRNVLMYFATDQVDSVVSRLHGSLIDDGWLIVSPQELAQVTYSGFVQQRIGSVFLFQKAEIDSDRRVDTKIPVARITPLAQIMSLDQRQDPIRDLTFEHSSIFEEAGKDFDTLHDKVKTVADHFNDNPAAIMGRPGSSLLEKQGSDIKALLIEGKIEEAEELVRIPKGEDRISSYLAFIIAKAWADRGEHHRALGWTERMIADEPLNPHSYHLRAVIMMEGGDRTGAIQSLKQALFADPDFLPAHMMLGNLYYSLGNLNEGTRYYKLAFDMIKNLPDDDVINDMENINAGRLRDMIQIFLGGGKR